MPGAQVRRGFSKRSLLSLWLLLVAVQAALAALPWIRVLYNFAQTEKQITLSGFDAFPLLTGQVLFGLAAWAAIAVSRAAVRRVLSWLLVLAGASFDYANLAMLPGSFSNSVPAKANSLVEKSSGIAGGGPGGISAAITEHSNTALFAVSFCLASVLLLAVQLVIALRSSAWAAGEKRDKYSVSRASQAAGKAAAKVQPSGKTQKSVGASNTKPKGSKQAAKGDNISLWDSQR